MAIILQPAVSASYLDSTRVNVESKHDFLQTIFAENEYIIAIYNGKSLGAFVKKEDIIFTNYRLILSRDTLMFSAIAMEHTSYPYKRATFYELAPNHLAGKSLNLKRTTEVINVSIVFQIAAQSIEISINVTEEDAVSICKALNNYVL